VGLLWQVEELSYQLRCLVVATEEQRGKKKEYQTGGAANMLSIISWNPDVSLGKVQSHDLQLVSQETSSVASPIANVPSKRKRSFDAVITSSIDTHAVKAPATAMRKLPLHEAHLTHGTDALLTANDVNLSLSRSEVPVLDSTDDTVMKADNPSRDVIKSKEEAQLATMRQTISSQLSLEILLKHRELRLIDQELAKCQVALEQLRRCSEIPYPALQQPSEQVTTGKGAALRKTSERFPAKSPAPWGVTDGPYSRHYAKWLLPDPQFDGGEPSLSIQLYRLVLAQHVATTPILPRW